MVFGSEWTMPALLFAAFCSLVALGDASGLRGQSQAASEDWPPPSDIYTDPAKPPKWMQPPLLSTGLAVPRTPPAPIAPSALIPTDPYIVNAAFFDEEAAQLSPPGMTGGSTGTGKVDSKGHSAKDAGVWPPSPPGMGAGGPGTGLAPFANLMASAPYRPLTLLDAKGGEYARSDPTISKDGAKNKKKGGGKK